MVGGAAAGKKWKPVNPQDLVKKWLDGVGDTETSLERIKRMNLLHENRLRREKKKKLLKSKADSIKGPLQHTASET